MDMRGSERQATVRVERDLGAWMHRLGSYKVVLDGDEVAGIRNGASAEFAVAEGEHQLWIVGWGRSALSDAQSFPAMAGKTVVFGCRATPRTVFRRSIRPVSLERRA